MWPATQNVRPFRTASRMRSMIFGWVFTRELRAVLGSAFGRFLQIRDDFEHAIAAHDRIIHQKSNRGRVFKHYRPGHQSLDPFAVAQQQAKTTLLLLDSS